MVIADMVQASTNGNHAGMQRHSQSRGMGKIMMLFPKNEHPACFPASRIQRKARQDYRKRISGISCKLRRNTDPCSRNSPFASLPPALAGIRADKPNRTTFPCEPAQWY
jgi:hypothetical protein